MPKIVEKLFLPLIAASYVALGAPQIANARPNNQDHVVSARQLQKDLASQSKTRQENEARLEKILATPQAREAMNEAGVDYKTVQKGVQMLNDAELAQLTARAQKAQSDFAAGGISDRELIIILLAVIVILIIVAAT